MTTNLDEDVNNESWGIRDLQVFIYPCAPQCKVCDKAGADGCS